MFAATSLLSGCAFLPSLKSVPGIEKDLPVSVALRRQLLGSVNDPEQLDFSTQISAIEQRITGTPLVSGNKVELLIDGPETHNAQLSAIANAQHHINLEMYIITNEELGQKYADALIGRSNAGVQVNLLFDSLGSTSAFGAFISQLQKANIEIRQFAPLNPLEDPRIWRLNRRNHRKMLIVDGKVAFTGGVNIMDEYVKNPESGALAEGDVRGWRDTHIKILGPAVAEFQKQFIANWNRVNTIPNSLDDPIKAALNDVVTEPDKFVATPHHFPNMPDAGTANVRLITSRGADVIEVVAGTGIDALREVFGKGNKRKYSIYKSYLAAFALAKNRIWITQSYFAPGDEFIEVLNAAAERGVDVRILVPGKSDVPIVEHASKYFYTRMLKGGIRLWEYNVSMIHSKTAVVDGVWSTVGSSNLDYRSFLHNDEANAVIIDDQFGTRMEALFERDIATATEITLETWKKRPFTDKIRQFTSALFKYWL